MPVHDGNFDEFYFACGFKDKAGDYCFKDVELTADGDPVHENRLLDLEHTAVALSRGQVQRLRAGEPVDEQTLESSAKYRKRDASGKVAEGFYLKDGVVFKVQKAVHGSGRLYAKELVPYEVDAPEALLQTGYKPPVGKKFHKGTWEYRPGAYKLLTMEHKLTAEQAIELGKLYGMCVKCGATLTREESIERGMGPICAGKGL